MKIMNRYGNKMINPWVTNKKSHTYGWLSNRFLAPVILTIVIGLGPFGSLAQTIEVPSQTGRISSELSFLELHQFGDFSIQDALVRIPGIQVGTRGEINIRGVGYHRYNVTVDGQRMGSTGFGDRSVDLSVMSIYQIRNLEVIKVLTPDMDADALSGTINLQTHQQGSNERNLSIRVGGGAHPQYFRLTGPSYEASAHYSEPLSEDISLSVNLSYQQDYRGREGVTMEYDVADFGAGPVDVLERVSPFIETDERDRLGGGLRLDYKPHDRESYFVRAMLNRDQRISDSHTDSFNANGDWLSPESTGTNPDPDLGLGSYGYTAGLRNVQTDHISILAGGDHVFDNARMRYSAGWAQSSVHHANYEFPFLLEELNYAIDMNDRERPTMKITNLPPRVDGIVNRDRLIGQNFERIISDHTDNKLSANMDGELSTGFGPISLGTSVLLTLKDANYDNSSMEFVRTLRMNTFNFLPVRNHDVLGSDYIVPWIMNTMDARNFFESQLPTFNRDDNLYHERTDISNYNAWEQIYSVYGMANLKLGDQLTLLGGLRAEQTFSDMTGRNVLFDETGEFTSSADTTLSTDYIHLFPNAQATYQFTDRTNVHLAFSRSVSRPHFNIAAPFNLVMSQDSILFRGNPKLQPVISNNLDLQLQHNISSARVGIGVFGKKIIGFVYESHRTLTDGEYDGWQELTFQNGDEDALLYGVELSWQQQLEFLPGFLRNLGLYANYTWSESDYRVDLREDDVRLPGHSPHVVNAAMNYSKGRFSGQLAYHWSAEYIGMLQRNQTQAPSIGSSTYYLDEFEQGWSDLSATFTFRISQQFWFWANASNILTPEQTRYQHTQELYPVVVQYRGGFSFISGIRYEF